MSTQAIVKRTRWYRKIHRWIGSALFIFFFVMATTGLLLGWKKNSNGYLLAESQQGTSTNVKQWLSFDSLHTIAIKTIHDSISPQLSATIDRIDARPGKGMVKFVFKDHYWAVQLDCATGNILQIEKRRADFIEHLHDGSILDNLTKNRNGFLKLSYTTIMGGSLLLLTFTGFWLWYNPKRIRNKKESKQD